MRYDAVLLDAGETLVHPEPSFAGLLSRLLGGFGHDVSTEVLEPIAREAFAHAIASATEAGRMWSVTPEASRAAWTGIYRAILAELSLADASLPNRLYDEFTKPEHYALFPDTMPALRELRAHGLRIGIVSNWEPWLADLLVALEVTPLCDVVVVSGAIGIEKPDERIFKHALASMEVSPERAVYVGDSPTHDVAPALALGMGAVLIDRAGRHSRVHRPTIESLEQLMAVIA